MGTHECQPLYFEIREFYEGLNMKVEQEIPLLLVERQALNEAMEGEKNVRLMYHGRQYLNSFFLIFIFNFFIFVVRAIITYPKQEGSACQKNKLLQQ